MKDVVIRQALPEDARGIQEVFYRSWLTTYPNADAGITIEDVEVFFKDAFSEETIEGWRKDIAAPNARRSLLVAIIDEKVIAVCRAFIKDEYNQLQAIYILPEYQRHGIGHRFVAELQTFFDPTKPTIVQVATYNKQAINFYERLGFVDTGKRFSQERFVMPVSGKRIPEMEMRKEKSGA